MHHPQGYGFAVVERAAFEQALEFLHGRRECNLAADVADREAALSLLQDSGEMLRRKSVASSRQPPWPHGAVMRNPHAPDRAKNPEPLLENSLSRVASPSRL